MSEVQSVLDKYGEMMVSTIKNKLQNAQPYPKVASGNLINSITYKFSSNNGVYNLELIGNKTLEYVDRGRRKGKYVPIAPLIAWIKIKRIPLDKKRKKMKSSVVLTKQQNRKVDTEEAIRGFAIAISKKIKKYGIKPFPILNLGRTITKSQKFQTELAIAAAKDLASMLKIK